MFPIVNNLRHLHIVAIKCAKVVQRAEKTFMKHRGRFKRKWFSNILLYIFCPNMEFNSNFGCKNTHFFHFNYKNRIQSHKKHLTPPINNIIKYYISIIYKNNI